MKLSERIRNTSATNFERNREPIADEVAHLEAINDELNEEIVRMNKEFTPLEAENAELQHIVDYVWQEIYEADEPILSVCSVEKLRNVALLTAEEQGDE